MKDAIDAQSGRFEFLKQTLTLGSAGIAGIAALFTDPARIPTDTLSRIAAAAAGISLISIVAFAAFGLSAYANFLTTLAREKGLITPSPRISANPKPSTQYADGVVVHARTVIVALFGAWISLLAFAGLQFFFPPVTGLNAALTTAAKLVSKQAGQPSQNVHLQKLELLSNDYDMLFEANGQKFNVRVAREGGDVSKFDRL